MSENKRKKGLSIKGVSIFFSCDEANHTCDKGQYDEANLLEKIKLNIHLLFCSACRKYSKNNTKLSKILKDKNVGYMKKNEVLDLEKNFDQQLKDFSEKN